MTERPKSSSVEEFDLEAFLPFILNQAAEETSRAFQPVYWTNYGLSRTQWRVLAILGRYGELTARDICAIAHEEKTRVSRAVAALKSDGYLKRQIGKHDKRTEILFLTNKGMNIYSDLSNSALNFNHELTKELGQQAAQQLVALLTVLRSVVYRLS